MTGKAMNRNILLDVAYSSQKCYIYGLNQIHIRIQQLYSYTVIQGGTDQNEKAYKVRCYSHDGFGAVIW